MSLKDKLSLLEDKINSLEKQGCWNESKLSDLDKKMDAVWKQISWNESKISELNNKMDLLSKMLTEKSEISQKTAKSILDSLAKNNEFLKILLANQLLDEINAGLNDGQLNSQKTSFDKKNKTDKKVEINPYSKENFIDRGDYIELKKPIGNIRMIEKGSSNYMMDWNHAIEYAENLRKGGFYDWRIPTKEELQIIYKIKDGCGIGKVNAWWFWSSTNFECLSFSTGNWITDTSSAINSVRCVR